MSANIQTGTPVKVTQGVPFIDRPVRLGVVDLVHVGPTLRFYTVRFSDGPQTLAAQSEVEVLP